MGKWKVLFETLIITLLVFIIGFSIGFYIESYRVDSIEQQYQSFEIGALDLKLQNYYYQIMDSASCSQAIEQNFKYADELYNTGLLIEKYEDVSDLKAGMLSEKKRYVLLKEELWLNSIILKNKCKNPFHTVVYFYAHNADTAKDAEQQVISNVLKSLKDDLKNNIILLPIAADMGLSSVEMQTKIYNVSYLPSILIDEKVLLSGYYKEEDIKKYIR